MTLQNSILADTANAANDLVAHAPATVAGGATNLGRAQVDATGFDLVETSLVLGANASITGAPLSADPQLAPLADYGGPTFTHALPATSPAVDQGSTPLTSDQRGRVRPVGGGDDIGAFELGYARS